MRDPVAEVLAERSATGNGLAGAVALSLILHAGGAALAVYSALRHPPVQPAPRLNIRLSGAPRLAQPLPAAPAAEPVRPAPPRIQEPAPQPRKAPEKAPEPKKGTVPFSPFGRSSKKGSDAPPAPPPPPPAPAPAAGAAAGEIGIGEAGVTGLEGGDFPYTLYLDSMKRLIGARWIRPQIGAGPVTVVYFRIDRTGTIRDVAVTTPSGVGSFDRAALRAVVEASPLPPLPYGYSGTYLGVHLTFK